MLLLILALTAAYATPAKSQSDPDQRPSYAARWLPTLTVGIGGLGDPENATAISSGDSVDSEVVSVSGSELNIAPQFIVLAGIESPELFHNLRVYTSGGVLPTLGFDIDVTKLGDPRGFVYPKQAEDNDPYPGSAIDGTGIRSSAQIDRLAWAANLGVSLGVDVGEHRLDIRPSVGYFRYSVSAQGVRLAAIKPDLIDPFVREISLENSRTEAFSAVGPCLELGFDLGPKGMFKPTLFVDASFYKVLGDRVIEMSDSGSDQYGTEVAYWTVMVNPWIYRLGAGLRVAWLGD